MFKRILKAIGSAILTILVSFLIMAIIFDINNPWISIPSIFIILSVIFYLLYDMRDTMNKVKE